MDFEDMGIERRPFGTCVDGMPVEMFSLKNQKGVLCEIINYGGAVTSLHVPDKDGLMADVVLGFDSLEGYIRDTACLGALIGRYANRIAGAAFNLDGVLYPLDRNFGRHHLHGGFKGFHTAVWKAEITGRDETEALMLSYTSRDGEGGYPGNLDVIVTYMLTEDNGLVISYHAVSDRDTVVNLTNHAYFNLSGHNSVDIYDHILAINADRFTVIDSESMPTGELRHVAGTPLDFTRPAPIGLRLYEDDEQLRFGCGYDHNYVLAVGGTVPEKAAECRDPKSGRVLEVLTTMPGLQFYTSNKLGNLNGKYGAVYGRGSALCLETQYYPDSPNQSAFTSPVLKAGQVYRHTTVYRFSARNG